MKKDLLNDVAVAISAFKSDDSVIGILRSIFPEVAARLSAVIVVDSLGSGEIKRVADDEGWNIRYFNSATNLGSAGNLACRLDLSRDAGARWCYAVNHDGYVDAASVEKNVSVGEANDRIAAVYPSIRYKLRGDLIEAPRTELDPFVKTCSSLVGREPFEVAWGSSNMALYNLSPLDSDVKVWADLWFGWEDLAYGGALSKSGWKQIMNPTVVVDEYYEYKRAKLFMKDVYFADKPVFYSYYGIRNLIIVGRRLKMGGRFWLIVAKKTLREQLLNIAVRDHGLTRTKLLWRGIVDGFTGLSGKGPVP